MRGPTVFEAGAIPPPEGVDEMSRVRPAEQGLYRSEYEHDACGVAFVARLDAQPLHETVRRALAGPRQPRASRRRGRRSEHRRRGRHPDADPRRVLPRRRLGGAAGGRAATASRCASSPTRPSAGASSSSCSTAIVEDEGQSVVCWRDVPVDPEFAGPHGVGGRTPRPAARRRGLGRARRPGCVRAQALRDPAPVRARGRRRRDHPELLLPHDRLQGDADRAAAPRLLPRPAGRAHRVRARARPLAVLDQHVPELGARPPVPDDRPQRRDQHGAREHQLDARARVAARIRAVRRRPPQGAAARPGGRVGLGRVRQRARAARARRPLAAARDDDDDPRGNGRARRSAAGAARVLRLPPVPDGGLGRPRGGVVHRRARDRLDARPQRPAARSLARDARRLGRARLRGRRARHPRLEHPPQGPAAARASSSSSISSRDASSPTTRSSAGSPPSSRTASGSTARSCDSPTCRRGCRTRCRPSPCASGRSRSATRSRT